jgi:hypothetical protein
MRKFLPVLYVLAGAAVLLIPAAAYAQGLVPCDGISCNLCELGTLMQKIINFLLLGFAVPLAAAMFAYAGILYTTAGSNTTKVTKAHKIFKNVLIGFLIAISGWLVIQTILSVVFDNSFWIGGNWNELQCVSKITNVPGQEGRLIGTNFNDLINEIIPESDAPVVPLPTGTAYIPPSGGEAIICPTGSTFNPEKARCETTSGVPVSPIPSGRALCEDTNVSCSVGVMQSEGLTLIQARTMSCIAMTESGGDPGVGCSSSNTPCGLFQINNGNWDDFAPPGCEPYAQKHNGTCNRRTAVRMLQSGLGYQPWSGRDKYGVHWNTNALTCVRQYDPNTSLKVI